MATLLRHRILVVLLLVLTFAVTAMAYLEESPIYKASASIVFIPSQHFGQQTGAGNQYLAFTSSLNQLGDVIRYEVSSSAEASTLITAGYTSSYTITDPTDTTAPILLVTTNGKSKESVENTLTGVDAAITSELASTQSAMKAANKITDKILALTTDPTLTSSSRDRTVIAVLLGGITLSYVIILAVESLQVYNHARQARKADEGLPQPAVTENRASSGPVNDISVQSQAASPRREYRARVDWDQWPSSPDEHSTLRELPIAFRAWLCFPVAAGAHLFYPVDGLLRGETLLGFRRWTL